MIKNKNRRFYLLSIAALTMLSAYPLINGIRMAAISAAKGAIEPEQYAKYVVPYAAICVSILLFAVLQPIFLKLKRFAFPAGLISAYGVFFVVERFFDNTNPCGRNDPHRRIHADPGQRGFSRHSGHLAGRSLYRIA